MTEVDSEGKPYCKDCSEAEKPAEKQADKQKHYTATVIKDKAFLAELNKSLVTKEDGKSAANGFWALASVERVDSDGDVIVVKGIQYDLNPEEGRYLPLLPSHMMKLPNAQAAEIGRIEKMVKTSYDGVPALAFYFTFALDEQGQPIDELVASYYKRYKLGYSNSFSVGMEALEEPERIKETGGFRFTSTKLYEVSAVAVPANPDALGLTRGANPELEKLVKELSAKVDTLNTIIASEFVKAFKPLESRLDLLEATLVTGNDKGKESIDPAVLMEEISKTLSKYNK
jgi:hypothetical protein